MPDLLTVRQASELTGLGERTIRSRLARGVIQWQRVNGQVMIAPGALARLKARPQPPDGYMNIHATCAAVGLTDAGVRARAKLLGLKPLRCAGSTTGDWWSPEQVEAMRSYIKKHAGGMKPGWRKNLPENHNMERHGSAADASVALCRTRKTMDPLAILRRVAASLPPEVPNHGVTRCDIENSIIHDVRELLARDARERNGHAEVAGPE
jgi:hypothetical protein